MPDAQSPMLEFESSAFSAAAGEDEETNPGILGRALAQWLAERLRVRGVVTGEPFAEDFGWCIPIESQVHPTFVACASTDDSAAEWRVFAFAERRLGEVVFGKDQRREIVDALLPTVRDCLASEASIRNLRQSE